MKRFVAFAFSAADILIETDLEGRIAFTAGALSTVKPVADARPDSDLSDCFELVSKRVVRTMAETAPDEGRAGPITVRCDNRPFDLSLWRMKGSRTLQWALRPAKGEVSRDPAFPGSARGVFEEAREKGRALDLAMIWLENGERVRHALGDEETDHFFTTLTEIAGLHSEGGVAGAIPGGGDTIGFVPTDPNQLNKVEQEIDEIAASLGLERVSARSRRMAVEDGELDLAFEVFVEAAVRLHETGVPPEEEALAAYVEKARRIAEARTKAVTLTVRNKLFEPYAQPLVDSESHEPVEYELLVRLPGGRSFVPGILLAEQSGITPDLDMAMAEAAIGFLKTCPDRPGLSVNLSAVSLARDNFSDRLATLVKEAMIAPGRLCFEITETSEIKDFDQVRTATEKLRKRGHSIALDDFGSGAAGIEYLMKLPIDRVKLDGALLPRTNPSDWERNVLKGMAELAHRMDATIVAEFVEHRWQALMLAQAGVDLLQGYLFGKPEPLSDLARRHPPTGRRESGSKEAFG